VLSVVIVLVTILCAVVFVVVVFPIGAMCDCFFVVCFNDTATAKTYTGKTVGGARGV